MKGYSVARIALLLLLVTTLSLRMLLPAYVYSTGFANGETSISTGNESNVKLSEHRPSAFEMEEMKREIGVAGEGTNYNIVVDGHGTGLRPPSTTEWKGMASGLYLVDRIELYDPVLAQSNVDNSAKPWFPPIGNQDGEGSCTTWAVGYYMKTFQEAKEHGWDLSGAAWEGGYNGHPTQAYQNRIMSPDFIYHLINGGTDLGSDFYDAINLVCSVGASSWEKMPYDPLDHTTWPSEEAWREAPLYRGNSTGYEYMSLSTDVDIMNLKNWIASDHLAVIGVDADQYYSLTSQDVWTLDNYASPYVNHANTIVGYDDAVSYVEQGQTHYGAFKIANSWGVGGWEMIADGYYWISYEAMKQRVEYCMFYQDRIGYRPKLLSTFRIDHLKRSECSVLIAMGNHSSPLATKLFSDVVKGGDHPFCPNNIVFDVTEFKDYVPSVYDQSFFIRVYDGGSETTGTVAFFSINQAVSDDTPIYTINSDYVFAEVVLARWYAADVNYDGVVNVLDAAAISAHWYPNPPLGPLGYDPDFDINGDGAISVLDAATVSAYWTGPPKGPLAP